MVMERTFASDFSGITMARATSRAVRSFSARSPTPRTVAEQQPIIHAHGPALDVSRGVGGGKCWLFVREGAERCERDEHDEEGFHE